MPRLSVHDDLPPAAAAVDAGIGEFNASAAPLHEVRPLSAFVHADDGDDATGAVLGGVVGRTWGACAEVQQLWVHETQRGRGLGTQLMRAFEARAAARGVRMIYLDTFSFQAEPLYRRLGYEVRLALTGLGHDGRITKFTMVRNLPASDLSR